MMPSIHRTARIDRSADVVESANIGPGCRVGPRVTILEDTHIAKDCHIGAGATVCSGVTMGSGCDIGPGAILGAGVRLAQEVHIGAHAICRGETAPRAVSCGGRPKSRRDPGFGAITIGQGATVGPQAVIEAESTIGCYALIGAGAVIRGVVPDYGLMMGNPARLVGTVCREGHPLTRASDGSWQCPICGETVTLGPDAASALDTERPGAPGIVRRWLGKG